MSEPAAGSIWVLPAAILYWLVSDLDGAILGCRFSNELFAAHIEKAANRFETWAEDRSPGLIASMRQMDQQMRSQAKKVAEPELPVTISVPGEECIHIVP